MIRRRKLLASVAAAVLVRPAIVRGCTAPPPLYVAGLASTFPFDQCMIGPQPIIGTTPLTVTIPTNSNLIIAIVGTSGFVTPTPTIPPTATGITDNAGGALSWLRRWQFFDDTVPSSNNVNLECWYSIVPSSLWLTSVTISAPFTATAAAGAMTLFACGNVDLSVIWDTNPSLPSVLVSTSMYPSVVVSTSNPSIIFAASDMGPAQGGFSGAYGAAGDIVNWGYPFTRSLYGTHSTANYPPGYYTPQTNLSVFLATNNPTNPINSTSLRFLIVGDAVISTVCPSTGGPTGSTFLKGWPW